MKSQNFNKYKIGKWGEKKAKKYLETQGYKIPEMNFTTKFGEIDLICLYNNSIIFVEVKVRRNKKFGVPQSSVDKSKQKKIKKIAKFYLYNNSDYLNTKIRFDVIAITIQNNKAYLKHFINAF